MAEYRKRASGFRSNAEEVRVRTETMRAEQARKIMLRLARHYEQLATDYDSISQMRSGSEGMPRSLSSGQRNMLHDPDSVKRYSSRADELRSYASTIKDKRHREDIESWASEYDQMALVASQMKQPW